MSRHHRAQKWTTHSPKLKRKHEAMLPRPCIGCGKPVTKEQKWQVGHIRAAMNGGAPTMANTAPVHEGCNLRDGGRMGARITNAKRSRATRSKDIRSW